MATAACSDVSPSGCPITDVADSPFTPGPNHPATPPGDDVAWFGTADLWTILPTDGSYELRKSIWWSENFEGAEAEPMPELSVTYERLNSHAAPVVFAAPGTHGESADSGSFIVNGRDPETPGCWKVTAEYRSATLSYTYETGTN